MSTRSQTPAPRQLLDPKQFEDAGRAVRRFINRIKRRDLLTRPVFVAEDRDTSIDWEDGEPAEDERQYPKGM